VRWSHCEAYRDLIVAKLDQGLSAQRIHQDVASEHAAQVSSRLPLRLRNVEDRVRAIAGGIFTVFDRLMIPNAPALVVCPKANAANQVAQFAINQSPRAILPWRPQASCLTSIR
jgi:hypothetical protein